MGGDGKDSGGCGVLWRESSKVWDSGQAVTAWSAGCDSSWKSRSMVDEPVGNNASFGEGSTSARTSSATGAMARQAKPSRGRCSAVHLLRGIIVGKHEKGKQGHRTSWTGRRTVR